MVGTAGFEPTASSTPRKRATKLRYVPTDNRHNIPHKILLVKHFGKNIISKNPKNSLLYFVYAAANNILTKICLFAMISVGLVENSKACLQRLVSCFVQEIILLAAKSVVFYGEL